MDDFFEYIKESIFMIDANKYENISAESIDLIIMFVVGLAIGAVIASISLTFTKRVLGDFIRGIIYGGCDSPSTAKTLSELGYGKNTAIRSALRSNPVVKKYIRVASDDEEKNGKKLIDLYKPNIDDLKFYIAKDESDNAEIRFEKKGTNPLGVVLVIIASVIFVVLTLKALPWVLENIDPLLGSSSDSLPPIQR